MFQRFANLPIECWLHRGKLGTSPTSLCLFHSVKELGSPILAALEELQQDNCPAQRMLTFAPSSRKRAISCLRLLQVEPRYDLQVMSIRRNAGEATIEMTHEGLELLIEALTKWLAGAEDFGVDPENSHRKLKQLGKLDRESIELWFWGPHYNVEP